MGRTQLDVEDAQVEVQGESGEAHDTDDGDDRVVDNQCRPCTAGNGRGEYDTRR